MILNRAAGVSPRGGKPGLRTQAPSKWPVWAIIVAAAGVQPAISQDSAERPASNAVRIDEILTQLQQRSDGLQDIRCEVRFVEDDRINLTQRTKFGGILFLMTKPNPHFLIHFEKTEADGVLGKQEWYLFDGQWLYQAVERIAQVTKQEVARPGMEFDLFDLEKAPFPVPFGQKRETILRNFNVTLASPTPGDPPKTDHLICVPKADSRLHRKYERLELFVHRDVHLPSRIVVTKNNGYEINTADFPDLSEKSINAGVKPTDFEKPAAWKKYKEVVEELVPDDGSP
ncbi:MAG: hypothetical protein V1790_01120 [Planctomycetota bacterium]